MIFIIDASVVVKWFVDEARREQARDLLREGVVRFVPEIVFCEVSNAFRRKIADGEIPVQQALSALEALPAYLPNVVPTDLILNDAFELSLQLSHPVADCLYLACARRVDGQVVTDDEKFIHKCNLQHAQSIITLAEFTLAIVQQSVLDSATRGKLFELSAKYQQVKAQLGRQWFKADIAIAAEHALKQEVLSLSADQRIFLLATCWFESVSRFERDKIKLKAIWDEQLARARADSGDTSAGDVSYLIGRMQDLELGLRRLSVLNPSEE